MKEGAFIGAVVALLIYVALPIYGDNGTPASVFPTAQVISDTNSFNGYVSNLPFSTMVFFALEIMGVSLGIGAQMVFRKVYESKQQS